MVYGIGAAVREMEKKRKLEWEERRQRTQVDAAIRVIDAMLGELERLNLRQPGQLPLAAEEWLSATLARIPSGVYRPVLASHSNQQLMDELYDALENLLALRSGPEWDDLRKAECEALATA